MKNSKEMKRDQKKIKMLMRLIPDDTKTRATMIAHGNHPRFEVQLAGILVKRWFSKPDFELKFYPHDSSWLSSLDQDLLESSKLSNKQLSNALSVTDLALENERVASGYVLLKYKIRSKEDRRKESVGKMTPRMIKLERAPQIKMGETDSPFKSSRFLEKLEESNQNLSDFRQDNNLSNINGLFSLEERTPIIERTEDFFAGYSSTKMQESNVIDLFNDDDSVIGISKSPLKHGSHIPINLDGSLDKNNSGEYGSIAKSAGLLETDDKNFKLKLESGKKLLKSATSHLVKRSSKDADHQNFSVGNANSRSRSWKKSEISTSKLTMSNTKVKKKKRGLVELNKSPFTEEIEVINQKLEEGTDENLFTQEDNYNVKTEFAGAFKSPENSQNGDAKERRARIDSISRELDLFKKHSKIAKRARLGSQSSFSKQLFRDDRLLEGDVAEEIDIVGIVDDEDVQIPSLEDDFGIIDDKSLGFK